VDRITPVTLHRILAAAAATLGLLALLTGDDTVPAGGPGEIGALEVAKAIRADPEGVLVVDIRDRAAWDSLHLPRAVHVPALGGPEPQEWQKRLEALGATRDRLIVVAGGPETPTRALWVELRKAGYQASYMPDMLADWLDTIISPVRGPIEDSEAKARWDEQAELSRYFGGFPRAVTDPSVRGGSVKERLRHARRRGCAI